MKVYICQGKRTDFLPLYSLRNPCFFSMFCPILLSLDWTFFCSLYSSRGTLLKTVMEGRDGGDADEGVVTEVVGDEN